MVIKWDKKLASKYYEVELVEKKYVLGPAIKKIVKQTKGRKLVDLGCGSGYYCRIFAKVGKKVLGVDKNQEQLNIALSKEREQKLGIKYIRSNLTNLEGVKSGSYGIALLNFVIIEIPSANIVKKIFKEARRILKKNGVLIIGELHPHNINVKSRVGHFILKNNVSYFDNGAAGKSIALLTNGKKMLFDGDHHYTLEFLVNSLIGTGFDIKFIKEPEWKEKFPIDIIIVAKKG
ncbi:MAG: class I SAM-dependent methyltransferase [Candidatus Aenigmarchaeota archaeon]|nr:class I SAM-dependent methyltransferase [Candidatus Aenigmarchaeota archaeon]